MKKLLRFFALTAMALTLVLPMRHPLTAKAEMNALYNVTVGQSFTKSYVVCIFPKADNTWSNYQDPTKLGMKAEYPDIVEVRDVTVTDTDPYIDENGTKTRQVKIAWTAVMKKPGTSVIWLTYNGDEKDYIDGYDISEASSVTMLRVYNPNSGEHFFTSDTNERNHLVSLGWKDEGKAWKAPTSGDKVYRLYNKNGGEHHYTLSEKEKNALVKAGWKDEGTGWFSDPNRSVPVYRVYNPNAFANNHHYTINLKERDTLVSLGWRNENIGWYGIK